ncbi:MAG: 2-methylisocitrate lyase-like PEP mutase family enzyme [Cellvibrionaceae bacterium]|jgi:2-methylisocitrate lyase-like PEP mutase family enzyme
MATQYEKAEALQKLHASNETFVIPNPWDIGSARLFEGLGFKALATTSSGFAYTLGRNDGQVTLDEKLAHCRLLSAATSIPISADLENLFAHDPETAAKTIGLAAETGLVGGSIEDYDGEKIYDFDLAVERVQAAVEAAKSLDFPFALTARAENLLRGVQDIDDTIRRLQAFEAAGADMLYAPGLKTLEQVRLVVDALSKPVNVLITTMSDPNVTVADLAAAGVRRVSIGGALAKVAYGSLLEGGQEMLESGRFAWRAKLSTAKGLDQLLSL